MRALLDSSNLISLDEIIRKIEDGSRGEQEQKSSDHLESYLMFTAEDMSK